MYGNNPNDYQGIGEAGQRTLRAMNLIIQNANNSTETKLSSTIQIKRTENEWKQDEIEKDYVSKIFYITSNANMKNYKIDIVEESGKSIDGIKITDMKNKEKKEFSAEEKFKVLVPIKNMTKTGNFRLIVEGQVKTKPVLYGTASNNAFQDYALTAATYEDGTGEKSDEYPENETKIIIIKEDENTKERISNTEFQVLDENKEIIYADLKTNEEGTIEIEHLMPGKYYIKETKAKEGYKPYEELIEIHIALHEQYTITVLNTLEENPKLEVEKSIKKKEVSQIKKFPVTGM